MPILVTGARGQLGSALCRQLGSDCIPCDRQTLDITDLTKIEEFIREHQPSAVINCAAFTNVDLAERNVDECMAINATAVQSLSVACHMQDIPLMQISTDYVFGGDRQRRTPYLESDDPAPLGVYSKSKLLGEQFASQCRKHFVVRTCGLFGCSTHSTNFVEKILKLAVTRDRLRVVDDQVCCPTFVDPLTNAILYLIESSEFGLYNIVQSQAVSWYEFAVEILRQSNISTPVDPVSSAEFVTPAERPRYSVLDCSKYNALGGPRITEWREALATYLAQRTS